MDSPRFRESPIIEHCWGVWMNPINTFVKSYLTKAEEDATPRLTRAWRVHKKSLEGIMGKNLTIYAPRSKFLCSSLSGSC
ncbi:hypothetical protein COT49_00425 [candidate division WWE3 bacterium CG08_land_8_20_14_0_20_40_13]|uniref:Uncharacterized protein n=1 Tax=candidate division WWE3 bacterium CG08_land_8_20_14_0_20_40_13 TaxID=1975084 RepID=A0A2H0XEL1_UNCKA|nr:MAG: hypothetical protein COT49_00425 [candidate division WWE3 bacterium CG08_land_8_20_14_0_20_40_13]